MNEAAAVYSTSAKTQQSEVLGAPLIVQAATSSTDQVAAVMRCIAVPSHRGTDDKKTHVVFWKDALISLPNSTSPLSWHCYQKRWFCGLFSYCPSGWWDSRPSSWGQGMSQFLLVAVPACTVFKRAAVTTGSDLECWVAWHGTDCSRFDHRRQRQPYF